MKLYDFAFSPNCRKVRAVAYELGFSLETVHVDLVRGVQKSPAFLAVNPNGRVPVLVDRGWALWESTAIMRYLSAQRGGALVPTTARGQAEVDRWLAWQVAHLGPAMSKLAFERVVKRLTGQGAPDEAAIAAGSAELAKLSALIDRALAGHGYLAETLSLADFALAAHYSLANACGFDLSPYPELSGWLGRVLRLESMQRALDDAQATIGRHVA